MKWSSLPCDKTPRWQPVGEWSLSTEWLGHEQVFRVWGENEEEVRALVEQEIIGGYALRVRRIIQESFDVEPKAGATF